MNLSLKKNIDLRVQQQNDAEACMDAHKMLLKYLEPFSCQPCNETGEAFSLAYYYACEPNEKMLWIVGYQRHCELHDKALQFIIDNNINLEKGSYLDKLIQYYLQEKRLIPKSF